MSTRRMGGRLANVRPRGEGAPVRTGSGALRAALALLLVSATAAHLRVVQAADAGRPVRAANPTDTATAATSAPAIRPDDRAAVAFVENFFRAFDARDLATLRSAFLPDAKIVHDDGDVTTVPQLLEIVRQTREWPPRTRQLSEFGITHVGGTLLVLCVNRVRFTPTGRPAVEYRYRETWVLVPTPGGLRAARSHYSAIAGGEHSEDVP